MSVQWWKFDMENGLNPGFDDIDDDCLYWSILKQTSINK